MPEPSRDSGTEQQHSGSRKRRRPSGRTVAVGIGVILVAVLAWLAGAGRLDRPGTDTGVHAESGDIGVLAAECASAGDGESPDCRFVSLVDSIERFWTDEFASRGASYEPAVTTLFSGSVRTGCGAASGQVGPFYCPADDGVYLDLDFFDVLRTEYGDAAGQLGEAYVLGHEYGHHIQNLTGEMWGIRPGSGPESDELRLELQADCYAGVWAHHADQSGAAPAAEPTDQDVADGLAAVEAAGDDYIEESFQGTLAPELWAHGSSAQRLRWFEIGLAGGALEDCDTFNATIL